MKLVLLPLLIFVVVAVLVPGASPFSHLQSQLSRGRQLASRTSRRTSRLAAVDAPFLPTLTKDTFWSCRLTFTANSLRTRSNKGESVRGAKRRQRALLWDADPMRTLHCATLLLPISAVSNVTNTSFFATRFARRKSRSSGRLCATTSSSRRSKATSRRPDQRGLVQLKDRSSRN